MNQKTIITILSVLVVVFAGATVYFALSQKTSISGQPFINVTNNSTQKTVQNGITEQDMDDLKIALEKEQPEYVSAVKPNYTIEVIRTNGKYIVATLYKDGEFIPSFPAFYAYLSDDGWKIIFSGQEVPECSKVNVLNFPSDIVTDCWDGNKQIRR